MKTSEQILAIIDSKAKELMDKSAQHTSRSMKDVFERRVLDDQVRLLIEISEIIEEP
jgi:hypothetical protein